MNINKEFREQLFQEVKSAEDKDISHIMSVHNRAEARRAMKHELKEMERQLGERGFGKRMCKMYKFRDTLKHRYLLTGKVYALMIERGDQEYFEVPDKQEGVSAGGVA